MDNDERAVWLRDLDGTGSMHPAAKGDPGAVMYVPASALRSSGEAVATICGDPFHGVGFSQWVRTSEILAIGTKLYLHPATVTEEDVERACDAFLTANPAARTVGFKEMRAALESFVRKQPAASAALERV